MWFTILELIDCQDMTSAYVKFTINHFGSNYKYLKGPTRDIVRPIKNGAETMVEIISDS